MRSNWSWSATNVTVGVGAQNGNSALREGSDVSTESMIVVFCDHVAPLGARSVTGHHSEVVDAAAESERPNSTLKNIFLGKVAQGEMVENMIGNAYSKTNQLWDRLG